MTPYAMTSTVYRVRRHWLSIGALAAGGIGGWLLFRAFRRGLFNGILRTIVFVVLFMPLMVWGNIALIWHWLNYTEESRQRAYTAVVAWGQLWVYWLDGFKKVDDRTRAFYTTPRMKSLQP